MASIIPAPLNNTNEDIVVPFWQRVLRWSDSAVHDDASAMTLVWAIRIGVILLFVTPLIVTTSTVFPFIVGKAVWSRSLIEIIVGLYVLLAIRAPSYRPTRSLLLMLFALHFIAVLVAGVFGSGFNLSFWSSYERMGGIFDLAHWFALAAVLVFTVRSLGEWKLIATISLVFGLGAAFIGLAEKYDYELFGYFQESRRISGATGNPSFLAGHMMVNAILALALLGDRLKSFRSNQTLASKGIVAFYVFTAAIGIWVLSETGTKGSMLGLMIGLIVGIGLYAVFSGRKRVRIVAVAAGVAMPIAVIVLLLARDTSVVQNIASRNNLVDRVVSVSLSDGSLSLRTIGLRISGQAFLAKPITGWGGENFEVPFQRYQREGEIARDIPILDRAHNKPLNLLATTGILGFSTYLALWGWIGMLAWRRLKSDPANRILHAGVAGALSALLIHELFLFDTAVTQLLFALLLAWAAGGEKREQIVEKTVPGHPGWMSRTRSMSRMAVPVAIAVFVALVLVGVNWRTYRAAQLITQTGTNVEEVRANLDYFEPLSTFGRERLLNVMSSRWDTVFSFDKNELALELQHVADQALSAEPNNMELHFAVARMYRAIATNFPEFIERARFHTDRGAELGPHAPSTALALTAQDEVEAALASGTSPG